MTVNHIESSPDSFARPNLKKRSSLIPLGLGPNPQIPVLLVRDITRKSNPECPVVGRCAISVIPAPSLVQRCSQNVRCICEAAVSCLSGQRSLDASGQFLGAVVVVTVSGLKFAFYFRELLATFIDPLLHPPCPGHLFAAKGKLPGLSFPIHEHLSVGLQGNSKTKTRCSYKALNVWMVGCIWSRCRGLESV